MAHLYIAMQFGLYTAAFIFLAYKGGSWLDQRFNTYPLFTILLILLCIVYVFVSLYSKLRLIEEHKNAAEDDKDNKFN